MIGLDEIQACAMALPEVSEGTHFGLLAFKVRDKVFVVVEKSQTQAILSVDQAAAKAAVAEAPGPYEEVWRNNGNIFVGLRVDLAKASAERVRELVELAWGNKAPKRLVAAHRNASFRTTA